MKKILAFLLIALGAQAQSTSPKTILQNYINAIGGEAAIKNITDIAMEGSSEMQGQNLTMKIYKKLPNKFSISVSMDGMGEVNHTVFDGKKGKMVNMGQEEILDEGKAKDIADKSEIIAELSLLKNLDSVQYVGKENVNAAECEVLKIRNGSQSILEYFDIKTSLLIRQKMAVKLPMGEQTMISDFSDFREVNKVKFPFKLNQDMGIMNLLFTFSSIKANTNLSDDLFKVD